MVNTKGFFAIAVLFVLVPIAQSLCSVNHKTAINDYNFCCCCIASVTANPQLKASTSPDVYTVINGTTTSVIATPRIESTTVSTSRTIWQTSTIMPTASTPVHPATVSGNVITINKEECVCFYNYLLYKAHLLTRSNSDNCFNVTKSLIYIGGFFDLSTVLGRSNLQAAHIAVEEINNSSVYLASYDIVLLSNVSTEANHHLGSKLLLDYLSEGPTKTMLLGPGDNNIAKTVASIAGLDQYQITQVSYGSTNLELVRNRASYSHFFCTKPIQSSYNDARIALLRWYDWRNVSLLYSTDEHHAQINSNLRKQLLSLGFVIQAEEGFVGNARSALQNMKLRDAHVIIGTFPGSDAGSVFCEAYLLGMYGPHYIWLLLDIVALSSDLLQCTQEQLNCAAYGQLFFQFKMHYSGRLVSGKNTADLKTQLTNRMHNESGTSDMKVIDAMHAYEAMWTIADTLNRVESKNRPSSSLVNFKYGKNTLNDLIRNETAQTDFMGPTGRVKFGTDGSRHQAIFVYQRSYGGQYEYRGGFDTTNTPSFALTGLIWPGGDPFKATIIDNHWRYVAFGLYVIYCILAAFGILFALFCLVVIIWKRNEMIIQLGFPLLSVVVIIGCLLLYVSVFLFGIDRRISNIVTVDRICRRSRRRRMILILVILFIINEVLLLCWHFTDPFRRTVHYIREQPKYYCEIKIMANSPFRMKQIAVEQCECHNAVVWYTLMIIWKCLVVIIGLFLAFQTRNMHISAVNDTQRCGICMVIVAAGSTVGFILAISTRLYPSVFFGLVGFLLLLCVTAILIILYLHKVVVALCQRDGRILVKSKTDGCKTSYGNSMSSCFCCSCTKRLCPCCFVACCLPFLACLTTVFGFCGKCCYKCCYGDDQTNKRARSSSDEIFTINGTGNDKEEELRRLRKELKEKEDEVNRLKKMQPSLDQDAFLDDIEEDNKRKEKAKMNTLIKYQSINDKDNLLSVTDSSKGIQATQRGGSIQIYNQKPDWSHVGSKLKATGAFKPNVPLDMEKEIIVINAPPSYDLAKSSPKLSQNRTARVQPENPMIASPSLTPVNQPECRKQGFPKSSGLVGKDSDNSPSMLKVNAPAETVKDNKNCDKRSVLPHTSDVQTKRSNVSIINAPQDYKHIKSTVASQVGKVTPAAEERGSVQIVNKPMDYSHVRSRIGK